MKLDRVYDIDNMNSLKNFSYDLAIFCSGYEERCTTIPKLVNKLNIKKCIVFGFQEIAEDQYRYLNDKYYYENWIDKINTVGAFDETNLYEVLRNLEIESDKLTILVDYSSMSRLWYAGILNWIRFLTSMKEVTIHFYYAAGSYLKELHPLTVDSILALPGFEGGPVSLGKSVALFGLGFDGTATMYVLDRLEPDDVYTFCTTRQDGEDHPKALEYNQDVLEYSKMNYELPLLSVETTFRYLAELLTAFINSSDVTLIPMGPKPHILASILLCMRFKEITCLHVSGKREKYEHIAPSGDYTITAVTFIP